MLLEICATSVQSVINAENAGAHRIELCAELAVGGITPSYGMIREVLSNTSLPIYTLIRPRSGDFVYSDDEFEIMKTDIEICKELGCAGIVSGVLNSDGTVDKERTRELIELSKPLEFTFHRAFDRVKNPKEALHTLIELGVNRILTSGQKSSSEDGLELLIELKALARNRLFIMVGGGVNPSNVHLFKENGFREIHASATMKIKDYPKPDLVMNSEKFFDESKQFESNKEIIKKLIELSS